MRQTRSWWVVLAGLGGLAAIGSGTTAQAAAIGDPEALPPAVVAQAQHLRADGRRGGRPFAIVDKQAALIAVYHADGRLAGASPALLGQDLGDATAPGVGARTESGRLQAGDRTTPAGRFVSEPGRNRSGESVVWLDYDAAFAIHRLRPGSRQAERQQGLDSNRAADKRLSAGCIVVPVRFFETVVQPLLGRGPALVEVLPEQGQASAG